MNIKKIISLALCFSVCASFAACSDSDSSSSADSTNESTATESTPTVVDYDVNGDVRLYDSIASTYKETGYKLSATGKSGENEVPVVCAVMGDCALYSVTVQGMKSETVLTSDKKLYTINEGTTTYSVADDTEGVSSWDILFGATGDFDSATLDEDTNTISEVYHLLETISTDTADNITYKFDGTTQALTAVVVTASGSSAEFAVDSLEAVTEADVALPDISSYTVQ